MVARIKGLSPGKVIFYHALKPGILAGLVWFFRGISSMIASSFCVEFSFNLYGLGRIFVDALQARDYPLIITVILVFYGVSLLCDEVARLVYERLNPQVSYGGIRG